MLTDQRGKDDRYLAAEARARVGIDRRLETAGWTVQDRTSLNLWAGQGVAVREFTMREGHRRADYLLFVDRRAVGSIEAKPEGTTLTGVEEQSAKYVTGLPDQLPTRFERLPFGYESTGVETRFTDGLDPEPRSRRVFTFHRPATLAQWLADAEADPDAPTLRHRLRTMPGLDARGLWPSQAQAVANLERSFAAGRPRALGQMATGAGKTFAAANVDFDVYRIGTRIPEQAARSGLRWEEASMPNQTRGLHHVVLTVTDVDRSARFYAEVLGLELGEDFGSVRCATDGAVHLCLQRPAIPVADDRFDEGRVGLDHLAFSVASRAELEATLAALSALGVETAGIEFDPGGEAEYVCFRDPDNIQVEVYASDRH